MPVQTVIKTRRSTAAQWATVNPILAAGEPGLETDTGLLKYGNGTDAWSALSYASASNIRHQVKAGEALTKGQAVYVSSANGDNMIVSKASNATEATSSKTMGLINETLANNGQGTVVSEGVIYGVNTNSATAGDPVWLGVNGALLFGLANKPTAPAHLVFIGIVTRVSATVGEIFVKVQNGYELDELHNVSLEAAASTADNEILAFDSASGLWKNQTAAEAGLATAANTTLTGTATAQNLTLTGNLIVGGTTTTVNATNLQVTDPLVYIAEGNNANVADVGIVGSFNDGTYQHAGIVRDATDSKWKLFKGVTDEPTTTVNFAQATMDTLVVGPLEAASATIGNVSNTELQYLDGVTSSIQTQLNGKAATSHTHAQSEITNLTTDLAAKAPLAGPSFTGVASFAGPITVNGGIVEKSVIDTSTVVASGGTYNLDVNNGDVHFISTVNQANNFVLNLRASSSAALSTILPVGNTLTSTFIFLTGSTAVGPTSFTVDGSAPAAVYFLNGFKAYGINCANSVTVTAIRGSAGYTLFVSLTKFAV